MRFSLLLLILTGLLSGCGHQPEAPDFPEPDTRPALQVLFPETAPRLGEPVPLRIRVTGKNRLVLPPLEDVLDPAIEVLDRHNTETADETGWRRDLEFDLALYAPTNVVVFTETEITTLGENPHTFELPFHTLTTTEVLDDAEAVPSLGNTELPDFRGPEALRRRNRNLLISLGGLFFLLSLICWLWWRHLRRPAPPPPPPVWHRIALNEIEVLRQQDIWTRPDVDACAVELGGILRRYIEGRFGIHAPERTTEEFLVEAQERQPWPDSHQTGLKQVFVSLDRIKFAGDRPDREVLNGLADATVDFVQATRPKGTAA